MGSLPVSIANSNNTHQTTTLISKHVENIQDGCMPKKFTRAREDESTSNIPPCSSTKSL